MKDHPSPAAQLSSEQEAIRRKCFHPTGNFVKFPKEDVETSIPDRFERISRQYPEQIAVKAGARSLTYSELNAMANRIARTILARRGGQVEPVGVLFTDAALLAAAMLGVLKAGKFFVLLDPLIPLARLALIVETSQTALMIMEQESALQTSEIAASDDRCLLLESVDSSLASDDLGLEIPAAALAYVVYTSGSTGHPKGVLQSHRNLLHRVLVRTNTRHLCAADRLAHLTVGTSNAITNVFSALLNGAALVSFSVREEGVSVLGRWLATEQISICRIGSPLFRRLCENLTGKEEFSCLRLIELTSDTIQKSDINLHKNNFSSNSILVIPLSSTETGLLTEYLIQHDSEIVGDEVPVGYPAEDKELFVLDDDGNEAGINKVGEIVVRSRFLSPGYWREPELTAAKFKADPKDGQYKLYSTGDLGLIRPDGCLVHKGRKDFRARVRGYSVEVAEVEHVLRAHAEIKDAVVVSHQDEQGETYLIAYLSARRQPGPSIGDMRRFLDESLPAYMIPPVFEILDEIPLTANGKVDRNALPTPHRTRMKVSAPYVKPRTVVERKLVKIWRTVLSLDRVGIQDNFFESGGHSLSATEVVYQIIKEFRLELTLQSFFQCPTVAEMATVIDVHQAKKIGDEELKSILEGLESLSEDEAERRLADDDSVTKE